MDAPAPFPPNQEPYAILNERTTRRAKCLSPVGHPHHLCTRDRLAALDESLALRSGIRHARPTVSDRMMRAWQTIMLEKPRLLAALLRLEGTIEMLAFVAVVMPHAWMAATHRWLGMGELSAFPLLDYMIRSVSLLYGLHGVLLLLLATDVTRFRPLIIYTAASYLLAGIAFTAIDFGNSMPWWWSFSEVGSVFWLGLVLFWLLRK